MNLPMPDGPRNPPILDPPIRLAVCVSGGGTTLQNLVHRIVDGRLRPRSFRWSRASRGSGRSPGPRRRDSGRGRSPGQALAPEFSAAIFDPIRRRGADLVILGGFLRSCRSRPIMSAASSTSTRR